MPKLLLPKLMLASFCTVLFAGTLKAQSSITTLPQTFTENFNGLPSTGSGDFSGLATGWLAYNNTSSASVNTSSTGTSNTSGYYSYGSTSSTDRALGCIDDATTDFKFGWVFENNTGKTIYKIYVTYKGEQWRAGETSANQSIAFSYAIGSNITDLSSSSFLNTTALNFSSLLGCTLFGCNARVLDGNANSTTKTYLINLPSGLADGEDIALRWAYPNPNNSTTSHGLAIDDVVVSFFDESWYLETGQTDLSEETNWTPFSAGTVINSNPTNQNFGDFVGDNQHFVINRDITLATASSNNFYVEGTNSYIIIDTGVTVIITDENLGLSGELILRDSSSLDLYILDEDNMGPDNFDPEIFPGVRFNSIGNESTVTYRPTFSYTTPIPAANYFHLKIATGDDFFEDDHDIQFSGAYSIAGDFTYELPSDRVTMATAANTPSFTFNGTDTSYINIPNFTGFGVLPAITVSSGATLALGSVSTQTNYSELKHNLAFTNNGTVYIAADKALNLSSTLTNTGTFNIADDASLIQGTGSTVSNSGTFNVTRNKPDGQASNLYNLWSTPVSSETVGDINPSRAYQLNAPGTTTANWQSISSGTSLTVGRGYAFTGVNSHTFSGTVNNGNISIAIESDGNNGNYNVIGNPYPSAINAKDFLDANATNLDGYLNLFSHNEGYSYTVANQQITINNAGATVAGSTDGGQTLTNTYIASCQGFYVQLNDGIYSGNINFTNSMRKGANKFFKSNKPEPVKAKFHMQLIDGNDTRYNTLFAVVEGTTKMYDRGWDAPAKNLKGMHLSTRDASQKDMCIQSIPFVSTSVRIPLNLGVAVPGNYSFHLEASDKMDLAGLFPYLIDTQTGQFWNLLDGDAPLFIEDAGLYTDRFIVIFSKRISTTTTNIDDLVDNLEVDLALTKSENGAQVIGTGLEAINAYRIFDNQGRVLLSGNSIKSGQTFDLNGFEQGLYLLNYSTTKGIQKTVKFIW